MDKKNFTIPTQGKPIAPGLLPGVKGPDLKNVSCKECGVGITMFIPITQLKHASPLQTVTGQPMLVQFQGGFACIKCGAVNPFAIEGVTDKNEKKIEASKLN